MVFKLRTAVAEDEDEITRLLQSSYGRLLPTAYEPDLLEKLLPLIARAHPHLLASGTYYLAVSVSGGTIGVGGWTRERPGTGNVEPGLAHIRHFAVHPDWAGRRVGRALVEHSFDRARAAGVERFECYSSLNAVDFYRRCGFLVVRPVDIPMPDGLVMPSMLMERTL